MLKDQETSNTRYGRLGYRAGLILVAVGKLRLLGGVRVVTHWTGQPMFSWGLMAAGLLCIVSALVPQSWMARAVAGCGKTHLRVHGGPQRLKPPLISRHLRRGSKPRPFKTRTRLEFFRSLLGMPRARG